MKRKRKRKKLKKRKMLRERKRKTFTMPVKRLWMMPKITSQYQYPRLKLLPKKLVSKRNQLVSEISRAMERMAE